MRVVAFCGFALLAPSSNWSRFRRNAGRPLHPARGALCKSTAAKTTSPNPTAVRITSGKSSGRLPSNASICPLTFSSRGTGSSKRCRGVAIATSQSLKSSKAIPRSSGTISWNSPDSNPLKGPPGARASVAAAPAKSVSRPPSSTQRRIARRRGSSADSWANHWRPPAAITRLSTAS